MGKERTKYSPEQKVAILKRHLVEGVPVSDICDTCGLHPTVFYGCCRGGTVNHHQRKLAFMGRYELMSTGISMCHTSISGVPFII